MNSSLAEMTLEECLEMLHSGVVGRVALSTPVGPRIVPVSFAVHHAAVVFRTAPYSELGTYGMDVEVAFEVDDVDYELRQGWSVVAIGRTAVVEDPDEVAEIKRTWDPQPWAPGHRNLYLKLDWRELSGRWVGGGRLGSRTPVRQAV